MTDDQFAYDLDKLSKRVGKSLAHKYRGTDAEDIAQAICLEVLQRRGRFEKLDSNELERSLRWYGNHYCMSEFDNYLRNSGNWIYTTDVVRRVLEHCMNDDAVWDMMPAKELTRGATVNAGGMSVFLWDLKEAYQKLNERERDLIELRFIDGIKPGDMSLGDQKAIRRGIQDITSSLNRGLYKRSEAHEGIGSNRAHTTLAAKARRDHHYDPEPDKLEDATSYRFCGG
ncbi:hypothetical protein ACN20G_29995 (plasmid) [Streptomyces sp. BI20]|uniref:hypothetical protein n=1 Tax=Streptomyces sp. BI20 TaxID=3403460 RepID=UPI003C793E30